MERRRDAFVRRRVQQDSEALELADQSDTGHRNGALNAAAKIVSSPSRAPDGSETRSVAIIDFLTYSYVQGLQHDAPIKTCHWVKEKQFLVTSGWDKIIRYWDARSPTPQFSLAMPDRVYSVDVKYPVMVVATADKKFYVFNLDQPQKPFRVRAEGANGGTGRPALRLALTHPTHRVDCLTHHAPLQSLLSPPQEMTYKAPMKLQTRVVKLFHSRQMFAVGSIEGRVALRCIDEAMDNA